MRPPCGHELGEHAAHRRAHDVGGVDAQLVEQPDAVVGHIAERVGGIAVPTGEDLARSGRRAMVKWVERPTSRLS
jgi:hypothetical protein